MICSEMLLVALMLGAGGGAAVAGGGSWVPLLVGPGGDLRFTKLLGKFVVGGCVGKVVGVDIVCWMIGGALMMPGLGSHGGVERW